MYAQSVNGAAEKPISDVSSGSSRRRIATVSATQRVRSSSAWWTRSTSAGVRMGETNFGPPFSNCEEKGREAGVEPRVHIRTCPDQRVHDCNVALRSGPHEGCLILMLLGIDIGPMSQ